MALNDNFSDFTELVRKISEKRILLPDFQRDFVWKDEEKQRKIVASVLTKMPIGSILLLNSKADEYSSKVIGLNKSIDASDIKENVDFLLDGQQRITVLTNVFSSIIHDECTKVSELVSTSLKRRFFLRVPRWQDVYEKKEADLFGVKTLSFPLEHPDSDTPEFLSAEILKMIVAMPFTANDNKPYNPTMPLGTKIDAFCIGYDEGYLIPLYMMISDDKHRKSTENRFNTILRNIAEKIADEISNHFVDLDFDEQCSFVKDLFDDDVYVKRIEDAGQLESIDEFKDILKENSDDWYNQTRTYLSSCLKNMALSQIKVAESQRARAIDIYENLNMGGVSLSTFDLIMARVAKVSKENFLNRLKKNMRATKTYSSNVLKDEIKQVINDKIVQKKINATTESGCLDNKDEINSRYVDAFLDVLSFACNNPSMDPEAYKLDMIKKDTILSLAPEDIDKNCDKVIVALDRAIFFFQTRCGIRSINELTYNLMLVLVATIFMEDSYYYNVNVHDLLEAWYWGVVFSGEYDKDQNAHMLSNLQNILRRIQDKIKDMAWLDTITKNVLKMTNFSDQDLLLMKKVNEDRIPKMTLRGAMCQYLLSKTYPDMFDMTKKISVFCDEADQLEAHHIIPLGTTKKVGEITSELRKNPGHVCNSPLNFVYITKKANIEISDESLDTYARKITAAARAKLYITSYAPASQDTEEKVQNLLDSRYQFLCGEISSEINDLTNSWR